MPYPNPLSFEETINNTKVLQGNHWPAKQRGNTSESAYFCGFECPDQTPLHARSAARTDMLKAAV